MFSSGYYQIFKNNFFYRTSWVGACKGLSVNCRRRWKMSHSEKWGNENVKVRFLQVAMRNTSWKVSKYGVVFWSVFSPNTGKYGPEETPYLDHFHAVNLIILFICKNFRVINSLLLTFTKFWSIRPLRCQLHTIMKVIIYFLYIIVICLFHDIIFPWFIYILTSKLLVFPFVCLFVCWI